MPEDASVNTGAAAWPSEVKLGTQAVDEVRRRVQQEIHGHRGRKNDPLYGVRTILRCGSENLTNRQRIRLDRAIATDERHDEVYIAWQCAQQLRAEHRWSRVANSAARARPDSNDPSTSSRRSVIMGWYDA